MLYYKLTALNGPIHRKIRTKTNPIQTADRWMRHIEAPWSLSNNLWVETMVKNKSVINVRPVSVGIYDLLTSQVAYFPHLPQLLAPGSQLASPLQILACNWRCFTVNWTTLHTTGLADMAPATPSHGPGLQLSPSDWVHVHMWTNTRRRCIRNWNKRILLRCYVLFDYVSVPLSGFALHIWRYTVAERYFNDISLVSF